jgi:hypothetical protein
MNLTQEQEKVLSANVYRPVFTKVCAARGYPLDTEDALQAAFKSTAALKSASVQQGEDLHKKAGAELLQVLGVPADTRERTSGLVSSLAGNPEIRRALLSR